MVDNKEEQLRQRAYDIWQAEGEPHGRDRDHWEMAERQLKGGEAPEEKAAPAAKPATRRKAKPAPETTGEAPPAEPKPKARKPRAAKAN